MGSSCHFQRLLLPLLGSLGVACYQAHPPPAKLDEAVSLAQHEAIGHIVGRRGPEFLCYKARGQNLFTMGNTTTLVVEF